VKYELHDDPEFVGFDQSWGPEADHDEPDRIVKVADVPSIFSFDEQGIVWAVDGFIPMSAVTLLSGDSGTLKSTVLTAAGRAVASGEPFAGMESTRREVLILDRGENTLSVVQERYRRLGITDGAGLRHYGAWLGEVPSPGGAAVLEWIAAAADPKPLVVVDSLVAFFEGDENSSNAIRTWMKSARALADLGAGVVVVHHNGKAETAKKYRGSSDIKAAVDVAWEIEGIGDPAAFERVRLTPFKSRFTTRPRIQLSFHSGRFYRDDEHDGPAKSNSERLRDLLIANPGIKTADFQALAVTHGLGRDRARTFLIEGKREGIVACSNGSKNAQYFTWKGVESRDFLQ
jgi:hypothetical protein